MIYTEPVFLQADAGGLPELKRVIVTAGDQIAMERTLEESLAAIFGTAAPPPGPVVEPPSPLPPEVPMAPEIIDLVEEASQHYEKALEYLKAGDWANYGSELDALKAILDRLAEYTAE
jgi:uncharacterized membrane protein (UPF0182 family)